MKKLILLLFIPFVSFGQYFDNDTIYYKPVESETKQIKHIITYRTLYDESTYLGASLGYGQPYQKHKKTFSYYKDGGRRLARVERRILDLKNENSDFLKEWVWSGNPQHNHYSIFVDSNRAYSMDQDYYVYDGITTIHSIIGGWMAKLFWISGWYIDGWRNEELLKDHNLTFLNDIHSNPQKDLNRELGVNQESIVDYYNIESLVKIFIEDCINNNLILPFFDFKWFKNENVEFQNPDTGATILRKPDEVDSGFGSTAPVGYTQLVIYYTPKIKATFESLEGNSIALSSGYMDDRNIIIKIDPEMWEKSSLVKRWYILYHELGHDILNLEHGEGGKMMFNFINKEYTWDDFINYRATMFDIYKSKHDLIYERKRNQATYYKP